MFIVIYIVQQGETADKCRKVRDSERERKNNYVYACSPGAAHALRLDQKGYMGQGKYEEGGNVQEKRYSYGQEKYEEGGNIQEKRYSYGPRKYMERLRTYNKKDIYKGLGKI